jgi:hypothetical protein
MGITAIRTPIGAAEERHHQGFISDRPYHAETVQTAYRAARKLIIDVVGFLVFLMLVALAAWIVMSSGAGHPTWL